MADETTYAPWCNGFLIRHLDRLQIPIWCVGLGTFAGYYVFPLILAAAAGTLVSTTNLTRYVQHLPDVLRHSDAVRNLFSTQRIADGLAYLNDLSHFLFALVVAFGASTVIRIFRTIHTTMDTLQRDGLPNENLTLTASIYETYRRVSNSWLFRGVSLILGVITGLVFIGFYNNPEFQYWWGNKEFGWTGVVFSGIEGVMVYYGTQGIILTAVASAMFARVFWEPLHLRPFHPDGANGLLPLGRMIMRLWLLAILLAAAIWVVLHLGYLGIEQTLLAWILAIIGLVAIPAIAIAPLLVSLRAIHKAQRLIISTFEPLLNKLLAQGNDDVREGRIDGAERVLTTLSSISSVHQFLTSINPWPFNPRALALAVFVYAVQLFATLKELFGL